MYFVSLFVNIGLGIDVLDFVLLLFSGRCCWISAGLGSCLDCLVLPCCWLGGLCCSSDCLVLDVFV